MYESDDIKVMHCFGTDVKNRYLKPYEHLYAMDTGAHYVCDKNGNPQAIVTASTTSSGGVGVSAGDLNLSVARLNRRRPMHNRSLLEISATPADLTTLGTVTTINGDPRTANMIATSAGSTARIFRSFTVSGLRTDRYYQIAATVDAFQSAAGLTKGWLGTNGGIAESSLGGTTIEIPATATPVVGQRFGFNFRPSGTSVTLRIGLGANFAETVAVGDRLQVSGYSLYEVDSIAAPIQPFYETKMGPVGRSDAGPWSVGSCILFAGDSWWNDPTDGSGIVGRTYGREIVAVATGGHTLVQIGAALDTAFASTDVLNAPNKHIPAIAIMAGGINDTIADVNGKTLFARQSANVAKALAHNIYPIVSLPILATNSSYYTAARAQAIADYEDMVIRAGWDYIKPADSLLNADGSANVTYMESEAGIYIHATLAGYALVGKLIDQRIREIERQQQVPAAPRWVL